MSQDMTYTAWALDAEQAELAGADPTGITIQESYLDDDGSTSIYTGEDMFLDTEVLADADDMDAALTAAGWKRVGQWDTTSGQYIAKVERV